jgi:hypothetical protein
MPTRHCGHQTLYPGAFKHHLSERNLQLLHTIVMGQLPATHTRGVVSTGKYIYTYIYVPVLFTHDILRQL